MPVLNQHVCTLPLPTKHHAGFVSMGANYVLFRLLSFAELVWKVLLGETPN
jgi:hypothetical protein